MAYQVQADSGFRQRFELGDLGEVTNLPVEICHRFNYPRSEPWRAMIWSATSTRSLPIYCGCAAVSSTSLLTRLISPASYPAPWTPIVSQVWQAIMHISPADAPSALETSA